MISFPISSQQFKNRAEAGRELVSHLEAYRERPNTVVLALPRGGVPVGYEVAKELRLPLDVFVVRKLGVPGQEELAMGAIASGGVRLFNQEILNQARVSKSSIEATVLREAEELLRRESTYRGNRGPLDLKNKTVILVDDGLATGVSMRAAVQAIRQSEPEKIVVAVPVASEATCAEFASEVDEVICPRTPSPFRAVGHWYNDFAQTSDEEVRQLLREAELPRPARLLDGYGTD